MGLEECDAENGADVEMPTARSESDAKLFEAHHRGIEPSWGPVSWGSSSQEPRYGKSVASSEEARHSKRVARVTSAEEEEVEEQTDLRTCFISKIPSGWNKELLHKHIMKYGLEYESMTMPTSRSQTRNRGFAFVGCKTEEDAAHFIKVFHGQRLSKKRNADVRYAKKSLEVLEYERQDKDEAAAEPSNAFLNGLFPAVTGNDQIWSFSGKNSSKK